jgi:hypothetical protein
MFGRDFSDLLGVAGLAFGFCLVIVLMWHVLTRTKRRLHRAWYRLAKELGLAFRPSKYTGPAAPGAHELPVIDGQYRDRDVSISMEWVRRIRREGGSPAETMLRVSYGDQQFISTRVAVPLATDRDAWVFAARREFLATVLQKAGSSPGEDWRSGHPAFDECVGVHTNSPELVARLLGSEQHRERLVALFDPALGGRLLLDAGRLTWETPLSDPPAELLKGTLELLCDLADELKERAPEAGR